MGENQDKPFVGMYTGLALRRGELKRGLSVLSIHRSGKADRSLENNKVYN